MITSKCIKLTLLAWLTMIGVDFFWHGGLLTCLYQQTSPFLLPPERAFALIPLGYLSFLLLAILLVWLITRFRLQGWRHGSVFALQIGALVWGSFVLGLYSIATAPSNLLIGWFVGQTLEMGVAGAVIGSGVVQKGYGRLALLVIGLVIMSMVSTIILQNTPFAKCA